MKTDKKEPISFRLSPDAKRLIKELSLAFGVSQADIVELAIRELGKRKRTK